MIKKYFYRYNLKSLKYSGKSKSNTPFIELATNILAFTNTEQLELEDNNDAFIKTFNDYFENLMTVAAFFRP